MKYVKVLAIVLVVLGVSAGFVWQFWGKDLKAQAEIGAAFAAKHVCSCLHVAERSLESCANDFVDPAMTSFTFNREGGAITAAVPYGIASATARFEPGLGCALVEN